VSNNIPAPIKKNPGLTIWIFVAIIAFPFLALIVARVSRSKKKDPTTGVPAPNKEVIKTVKWYHKKGMEPNSVYAMLTRMQIPPKEAYKAVYDEFYKDQKK